MAVGVWGWLRRPWAVAGGIFVGVDGKLDEAKSKGGLRRGVLTGPDEARRVANSARDEDGVERPLYLFDDGEWTGYQWMESGQAEASGSEKRV